MSGRPKSTPEEIKERKNLLLTKIEPYLKTGLSVNKALGEAQVANSEFYRYMSDDEDFRERINAYRNFTPILLNNAIIKHLQDIIQRQNGYTDKSGKKVEAEKLRKDDIAFLQWFALNNNLTKGEYGERKSIDLFDPEAEIQKVKSLIDEMASDEIKHESS